jgi:hypothetical protein
MAADELVAVYDAGGAVVGKATRREVRAKGLWHAAGVVLVRSPDGESAYVHRRSPDKDVFPGMSTAGRAASSRPANHPE